jgi:ubiquinone/menaquinone biosynthesis C-methylase UbiE
MSAPADKRWIAKLRAEGIQPFVRDTDKVLEYGARDGLNLAGVTAARKLSVAVNAELTSFRDVDVVLCHHVLECLEEPREIVLRLKEVLKPGGTLLVVALYDKAFRDPNLTEQVEHFYSWNVQTLGNLMVDCGYEFLSGEIQRCSNEESFLRWAPKIGYSGARFACGLFAPEFKVVVAAKRR